MKIDAQVSPVSRLLKASLLAATLLAATAGSLEAQQFSADLVARKDETTTALGRLRVSDGKERLEAAALPDGFFLIDMAGPAAYFVRPGARVFMDAKQSSPLTGMLVPVDPNDPCRQWLAMAQLSAPTDLPTWHCQRESEETIAGRAMYVYRVATPSGSTFLAWVDRERRFPVRIKTEDGTIITADRIRDEPQPAQAFEIPAGIGKFDPQALIRRIKQSDVWVAQPDSE
ncbi:hypothetical protein NLM27_41025 [Bradyrhizobium sp. CCGB12]|uniref:hypothetical protein n=1 Tax=Bradyrhizobium sp. CCGB12 TaxID=2949632 RepID=UPI0020B1E3BB|nr:hypothetical protein [Bradyrhizobium sp. CCGB12]MCP3395128.1 hypothetical protein [Bradyrhizobium sp. CCGB12]